MNEKERVIFQVSKILLESFDEAIKGKFDSRSHAFRTFMREVVETARSMEVEK